MRRSFSLLILATLGCSSASTAPAVSPIAGEYVAAPTAASSAADGAILFTTTANGMTTDQSQAGAEIRIVLAENGTTSGRLFIPNAPAENGGTASFTADLAGTWTIANGLVSLRHAADTFLRDMPLVVSGDRLVGDRTFGSVRIRVSLVRR